MTERPAPLPPLQGLRISDYEIHDLEDEIRVDRLCVDLLKHLFLDLTREGGCEPEQAGEYCHGADYFLREFIIADRNINLFTITAYHVRQFAGHWYIIRTMEPNMVELGNILAGTTACYRFLATQGLITKEQAEAIEAACDDRDFYARRIDQFWAIEDGGYEAWRAACPLEAPEAGR
jgi:hypothetical protein